MKFSYSWIRSFVEGLDMPAEALERLITMKTAECEGVENPSPLLAGAAIATVLSAEPVEGSNHLQRATIDAGPHGRRTVVCGAPNCRRGLRTVWVPLGFKTIAGIASDGMLASAAELGIGKDGNGIIELGEADQLPAADSVIEIDNKSITHRPDLWGHHGMAREVAAITGKKLLHPIDLATLPAPGGPVKVEIEDLALCPRYSALVFENVTVQPSPLWLQHRLMAVGLNPINNIVDLTNFIMAELAQPMHAFDRAKLTGETIYARPAREGEQITALNDEHYQLTTSNLVIADGAGPIAIAGVIGGRDSAISEGTTSIVLESANFHASSVRKTSAALRLRTDASMRFEKAQDPHNTVKALARALELLPVLSPGIRLVGGLADLHGALQEPGRVIFDLDWAEAKLGRSLSEEEVTGILTSLGFGVQKAGGRKLDVTIPTWRATKDIAMPEDIVEEIGRMVGYDSIEPKPPLVPCAPSYDPPEREFLRRTRRMVASQGFTEVSNYSFVSEEEAKRFGLAVEDHVRVLNPIAAGQELMRTSLLPGIWRNVTENARHLESFRLFEIGREIHKKPAGLPDEKPHLAAAIFAKDDGRASLFELRRLAGCLAADLRVQPAEPLAWEHPTRCAELWWKGARIGRLSELHPSLMESGRAAVVDLDLTLLMELAPEQASYTPVRKYPTSAFDLSVICAAREHAATLELEIRRYAGELAEAVEYVREYQGAPLEDGKKSVSFRVVAGAADHTLTSDEITSVREKIIEGLSALGYELRV